MQLNITYDNQITKSFEKGIKAYELIDDFEDLGPNREDILAISINENIKDLSTTLTEDCNIKFLTFDDEGGKDVFWHSSAHVMAYAVKNLYPDVKIAIGPTIENGFYYDFDDIELSDNDFKKIEAEIKKIIKKKYTIERDEITKDQGIKLFFDEPYKIELINDLEESEIISTYKVGEFLDLCRGPHLSNIRKIRAVKLMKVAGAYWRGDSNNKMLTRVYGISFPSKELMKDHLDLLAEAERRDHRKLGRQLDMFSFHPEGPGFAFWHDKGMVLKNIILEYWQSMHRKHGYEEINTPIMLERGLWETSGHWNLYKENMYITNIDEKEYVIKPMNCPGGIILYKNKLRSYKDLPLKVGELGLVHRHELSGTLHGLLRARQFVQDDAHIYCTEDQLEEEIVKILDLATEMLSAFGFKDFKLSISVRSDKKKDKYLGTDKDWELAEDALKNALKIKEYDYVLLEGEAKFYGPSIDVLIRDCLNREWQCTTIQLDFNLAKRFELEYITASGDKKTPIMLHRTVLGSLERFIGVLIEHYAGALPTWLAPIQIRILPIADRHIPHSEELKNKMIDQVLRVELDNSSETLNKKVRNAELQKIPYMIIIGDKEIEENIISVRNYHDKKTTSLGLEEFIIKIKDEIKNKVIHD